MASVIDRRVVLGALLVVVAVAVTVAFLARDGEDGGPARETQLTEVEVAAAFGASNDLYAGLGAGTLVAAERTAAYRELIDAAADGSGFDPDLIEALVFVESAGQPEAIAGADPVNASGLTQILAETATGFLDMGVDLARSRALTLSIAEARSQGDEARVEQLQAERRSVDDRFDPVLALAGTVRYLTEARSRFGRDDLAFVSYHMGIGNLDSLLRDYAGDVDELEIAEVVTGEDMSYADVYFGSSPLKNPAVWERLASFGDDSANYYWKVLAAREIMRLYREDRDRLDELIDLHNRKNSSEEVLHPSEDAEVFETPADVEVAWGEAAIVRIPKDPDQLGFTIDTTTGELAREVGRRRSFYRGLRPDALAVLKYIGAQVRAISGEKAPLRLTSAVRDEEYQAVLVEVNPQATPNFSLHTTGYAFDIKRQYGSRRQAKAFQFVLDRLEALGLIAWAREPTAIHITVASGAGSSLPAAEDETDDGATASNADGG